LGFSALEKWGDFILCSLSVATVDLNQQETAVAKVGFFGPGKMGGEYRSR
jgi:hypothetical protein